MKPLFLLAVFTLLYTWAGYPLSLLILAAFVREKVCSRKPLPRLSVLVAAYNEEKTIENRLQNIIDSDYPKDLLEIVVASDGSSDRTVELASAFGNVTVLDFPRRGRSLTHNEAVKRIESPIVILTDSATEFDRSFLATIAGYFSYEKTGCAVGNLIYKTGQSAISECEGKYLSAEKKIRHFESKLNILATGSGACMALRKGLWTDLPPTHDADSAAPLDVIKQGYTVVYAEDALAYDVPPSSVEGEFRARVRQVSQEFVGIIKRLGWRGIIEHPLVSWGLFSHKILRWLTPFFMLIAFATNIFLLGEGPLYRAAFTAQSAFYLLAVAGFLGELGKKRVPLGSPVFSFCVANIGMGMGVIKGLAGRAPAAYKTTE